ncbi:MAG TPA: F0F1 ATP synthase subunit B [Dehalococcoidia bacterium]|jgi:F-type H+-transporting ATPase subunit b|nr:F0F1 ATP synthase subunit B [Dehalococcoidia bacterium]
MVVLGIADLGINLPVLVAQIVNFTILLVVLRVAAWGPITRMLDERRERIRESLAAADEMKSKQAESDRQVQEQIEAARREGQALVAQAQEIANRIQADARAQAQADAEATLARARNEIQLERDSAIADLRKEFADLTIAAAEKVINSSLDRSQHRRLIDEALAGSSFRETN